MMSTTMLHTQPPVVAYGHDTPHKLFRARGKEWADQPALRHKKKGIWASTSWAEYYDHARAIGLALADSGLKRGDAIGVLSENRPEWLYADMGAQCMGILCAGIYPTSSPEQLQYVLNDAQIRVLFVENQEQYDKVATIRQDCPSLQRIVITNNKGLRELDDAMCTGFEQFVAHGQALRRSHGAEFEAAIDAGKPDDIAFLVYTSGTTGAPKGAMVSNRNLAFQIANVHEYLQLAPLDRSLSFLPLCHIAERMGTVFNPLALGQIVHFPENASTIFNDVREVAPQALFGPPRFWQKLHTQITLYMQDAMPMARSAYTSVTAEGAELAQARLDGQTGDGLARHALSADAKGRAEQSAQLPGPAEPQERDDRRRACASGPAALVHGHRCRPAGGIRTDGNLWLLYLDAAGAHPHRIGGHRLQGHGTPDRARQRDPGPWSERICRLLEAARANAARPSTPRAGCIPATAAKSTPTVICTSRTGSRTSSSPRAARTSRRATSRATSSSANTCPMRL